MAYQQLETKKRKSFSEAIKQEPLRFLGYIDFSQVEDFSDFRNQMHQHFEPNAKIDETDLVNLWETPECKALIKENIPEKYEKFYGDGDKVVYVPEKKTTVIVTGKKVPVNSYTTKKGKTRKSYTKIENRKFTNAEIKFLKVRRQKKISPKQIIKQYEQHFSKTPRTSSSIRSKIYRV